MNVKVSINGNCELVVTSELTDFDQRLYDILYPCGKNKVDESETYVEFLIHPDVNPQKTLTISSSRERYVQQLPYDGLYFYCYIQTVNESYITEGYTGLYYDSKQNKLILAGKEVTDLKTLATMLDSISGVLEYHIEPVFSICKLKRCVTELQKQAIGDCKKGFCGKADYTSKMRDFLFISIYILESLICEQRYTEATELLTSISQCGTICDTISYKKSGCNCHG